MKEILQEAESKRQPIRRCVHARTARVNPCRQARDIPLPPHTAQAAVTVLRSLAVLMFPEGKKAPVAAPIDGAPAELTNELIVNAKEAVKKLWADRRYDKLKPKERHAALGYKLDKEEALGYVVCRAIHMPLLSPAEARTVGKRAGVLPVL